MIFGDVELTTACAAELNKVAPEHDIMITAEAKGIPLVYEMARQRGENNFLYPAHVISSCKTAALRPLCGKYTMFCNRSAMEIPAIQASLCRFRKHFIRFTAF